MTIGNQNPEHDLVAEVSVVKTKVSNAMNHMAAAGDLIRGMLSNNDLQSVSSLLSIHCGLGPDDIRILEAASSLPRDTYNKVACFASPEGLRAIALSNSERRDELIRLQTAGHVVGKSGSERLDRLHSPLDVSAIEAQARRDHLQAHAVRVSLSEIEKLEAAAEDLLDGVWNFIRYFVPEEPDERADMAARPGYLEAHADIVNVAQSVLLNFDRIMGEIDSSSDQPLDSHQLRLENARAALDRFASGRFGHPFGFALDESNSDLFAFDLYEALGYICPTYFEETNVEAHETSKKKKPNVVEFGAGCGGMALGLMSAGFDHRVLYEDVGKRVKTLRANWPEWNVVKKELSEVAERFSRGNIDLFAGTLPREAFPRKENEASQAKMKLLLQQLRLAVGNARPRAFLFGFPASAVYKPHLRSIAALVEELSCFDYTIEVVRLELKHFGLPQSGERIAIVGVRKDQRDAFVPPALAAPVARDIPQALGDLVILHETPANLKDSVAHKSPQYWYDTWAIYWRAAYADKFLPTIPVSTEVRGERWGLDREGFDSSEIGDAAPGVDDIKEDKHYKPKLTVAMAARAQGFPDEWTYQAISGGNMDMIAEAFPPILAKALGLRLYSVLTGNPVDLDRALAAPLVETYRIGRWPLSLNSPALPPALRRKMGTYQRVGSLQSSINSAVQQIIHHPDSEESEIAILKDQLKSKPTDRVTAREVAVLRQFVESLVSRQREDEAGYDDPE